MTVTIEIKSGSLLGRILSPSRLSSSARNTSRSSRESHRRRECMITIYRQSLRSRMTPLGTEILLLSRYLASSSGYGHREGESRYSTYSYPDEDQYSTYSPRPSAYRARNGAETHHKPRRQKHRRTRPVTSHSLATRDCHQEQQYSESAEPRSPRPAKPDSQYAHDDSYASGRVSPASSQEVRRARRLISTKTIFFVYCAEKTARPSTA